MRVDIRLWESLEELFAESAAAEARRFFFTTKTHRPYFAQAYRPGDWFFFGRETKGLPESLLADNAERCVTIPMGALGSTEPKSSAAVRSLNLSVSVAVAVFEARRQFFTTPCI